MLDNVEKLLRMIEASASATNAAFDLAADLAGLLSADSQEQLKQRFAALRAENEAGHARFQAKLDAIIQGGK